MIGIVPDRGDWSSGAAYVTPDANGEAQGGVGTDRLIGDDGHMYLPKLFQEDDLEAIHRWIRDASFATLVTTGTDGAPQASHLPFLLDASRGPFGVLRAHMARANPQWQRLEACQVLVIFQGPHGYISPRWYGSGESVPTWNYIAVHAYGQPRLLDSGEAEAAVRDLVTTFEGDGPEAWRMDGLSERYIEGMLKGIVAFEIPIDRIEAKAKLSQNRPADVTGVIAGLRDVGDADSNRLATAMEDARTRSAQA